MSPALLKQMNQEFVAAIDDFARAQHIPVVHFERGQRTEDVARKRLARGYLLTPLGRRVAFFMTKSFARVVRPVLHRLAS